jgi:hypothetical protein
LKPFQVTVEKFGQWIKVKEKAVEYRNELLEKSC